MIREDKLTALFKSKKKILSIYLTAGYPTRDDTASLCRELEASGVDMIEVGFPFSDPLADGPVIQKSSEVAIKNGMTVDLLFAQLATLKDLKIPIFVMGYFNPVLQYGVERFVARCQEVGVSGLILPDLPMDEYLEFYEAMFTKARLHFIHFITPNTSLERIRKIDALTTGFIYAISSPSITGGALSMDAIRVEYFQKIRDLKLKSPVLIGFGISDQKSFATACEYTHGAIIGTAFIRALEKRDAKTVSNFIRSVRNDDNSAQ